MKKPTPKQLEVLRLMAGGCEAGWHSLIGSGTRNYVEAKDGARDKTVTANTTHALQQAGWIEVAKSDWRRGTYRLTEAGRKVVEDNPPEEKPEAEPVYAYAVGRWKPYRIERVLVEKSTPKQVKFADRIGGYGHRTTADPREVDYSPDAARSRHLLKLRSRAKHLEAELAETLKEIEAVKGLQYEEKP